MKTFVAAALVLALASCSAQAAQTSDVTMDAPTMTKLQVGVKDLLTKPTALVNKNTLAMDNNVFVTKSNLLFSQADRLNLVRKVEALVSDETHQSGATAVLSKQILNAVSAPDTDTVLMTKANAVVASMGDRAMMTMRINDLVDAVMKAKESDQETGVVLVSQTKDILRHPVGVVNKNVAVTGNQIAIANSKLAPSQNDKVVVVVGGVGAKSEPTMADMDSKDNQD